MSARAWKARKTLTEALRRSGAPIPLTRGFQVARNRVSPLQSSFARHRQLFGWLVVVDRRCYSDGGLGFSPDGFRLCSRHCRNREGIGEIVAWSQTSGSAIRVVLCDFFRQIQACYVFSPARNRSMMFEVSPMIIISLFLLRPLKYIRGFFLRLLHQKTGISL